MLFFICKSWISFINLTLNWRFHHRVKSMHSCNLHSVNDDVHYSIFKSWFWCYPPSEMERGPKLSSSFWSISRSRFSLSLYIRARILRRTPKSSHCCHWNFKKSFILVCLVYGLILNEDPRRNLSQSLFESKQIRSLNSPHEISEADNRAIFWYSNNI